MILNNVKNRALLEGLGSECLAWDNYIILKAKFISKILSNQIRFSCAHTKTIRDYLLGKEILWIGRRLSSQADRKVLCSIDKWMNILQRSCHIHLHCTETSNAIHNWRTPRNSYTSSGSPCYEESNDRRRRTFLYRLSRTHYSLCVDWHLFWERIAAISSLWHSEASASSCMTIGEASFVDFLYDSFWHYLESLYSLARKMA